MICSWLSSQFDTSMIGIARSSAGDLVLSSPSLSSKGMMYWEGMDLRERSERDFTPFPWLNTKSITSNSSIDIAQLDRVDVA